MPEVVTVLGVIIGLAFLVISIYKGLNPPLASLIAAFIVIATSGQPFQEAFDTTITTVGSVIASIGPAIVIGNMMGMVYSASGVCLSMGKFFTLPCRNIKNPLLQKVMAVTLFMLARIIIGLSGIDGTSLTVATIALALAIFAEYDISARYIPAIGAIVICIGNMMPGIPGVYNLLAVECFEGFTSSSAMLPRLLILIIYFVLSVVVFAALIKKDVANEVHFVPSTKVTTPDVNDMKLPPWWMGLIPIVLIFVTYNFCGLESWSSLALGLAASVLLFGPYIPKEEGKSRFWSVINQLNVGSNVFPLQWLFIMLPTMAMSTTGGLDIISNGLSAIGMPALLTLVVLSLVVMGFGGSQCMPVIAGMMPMMAAAGLSTVGVAMIALWGSTVFDTLPNSAGVIISSDLVDMPMSKSYPVTFYTTVLLTFGITLLVTVFAVMGIF